MKTVTRYEFEIHEGGGEVVISEDGGFVDYDDYIALLQVNSALQLSHDNIINSLGIKGDDSVSKLVIEYVMWLVAENVALKECCKAYDADGLAEYGDQWEVTPLEIPATDAAIAEIKAQGIEKWIESRSGRWNGTTKEAEEFAANLRAGRNG